MHIIYGIPAKRGSSVVASSVWHTHLKIYAREILVDLFSDGCPLKIKIAKKSLFGQNNIPRMFGSDLSDGYSYFDLKKDKTSHNRNRNRKI